MRFSFASSSHDHHGRFDSELNSIAGNGQSNTQLPPPSGIEGTWNWNWHQQQLISPDNPNPEVISLLKQELKVKYVP